MDMETVSRVAEAAGVGLEGVTVFLDVRPELAGSGFLGLMLEDGSGFSLFPDAFEDIETLAATLGHERTHVYQYAVFGKPTNTSMGMEFETAAYASEQSFLDYLESSS